MQALIFLYGHSLGRCLDLFGHTDLSRVFGTAEILRAALYDHNIWEIEDP
jgi:hypothetical protein